MDKYRGSNPKSFLGYTKQISRGMYYLLTFPCSVRLEHEDDVSVINNDGKIIIVEQCKATSSKIHRTSSEFLNTLCNWVDLYTKSPEKITNQTEFILFLENNNEVDNELDVFLCSSTQTLSEKFLNNLLKIRRKSEKINDALKKIHENKDIVLKILNQFKIKKQITSTEDEIKSVICKEYNFLGEDCDDLYNEILGWATNYINTSTNIIEIDRAAYNAFLAKYYGYKEKLKLPSKNDIDFDQNREENRLYIKQLKLVTDKDIILKAAMVDFLRYKNMIKKYLLKGDISQTNINDMYDSMITFWEENKEDIYYTNVPDNRKGYLLYLRCVSSDLHLNGASFYDKESTARGAYNFLADEKGGVKVGWHPKYKEKLGLKNE